MQMKLEKKRQGRKLPGTVLKLAATDAAGVVVAVLAVRGGRRFSFSLSLLCFFSVSSLLLPFSSLPSLLSSLGLLPLFSLLFPLMFPLSRSPFSFFLFLFVVPPLFIEPVSVAFHCGARERITRRLVGHWARQQGAAPLISAGCAAGFWEQPAIIGVGL